MSENEVPDEERLQQLQDDIDSARKNAEDAELLADVDERESSERGEKGDQPDDTRASESDDSADDGADEGAQPDDSRASESGDSVDEGADRDDTGEREFHESGEEGKELDDQAIAPPG